jgi:hypothetical protein
LENAPTLIITSHKERLMPAGISPTPRRQQRPIKASTGRKANAIPTTLTLDVEAKHLLRDLATGKTFGAYVSGLIRAEAARKEERQRLRRLLEEE